jgi:hypothetical protein
MADNLDFASAVTVWTATKAGSFCVVSPHFAELSRTRKNWTQAAACDYDAGAVAG